MKYKNVTILWLSHYTSLYNCLSSTAHVQLSTEMRKKWDVSLFSYFCELQGNNNVAFQVFLTQVRKSSEYILKRSMIFCFLLSPVFVAYLCFLKHDTKYRSGTILMESFTNSRCLKIFPRYKRHTVKYEVFMFVPKCLSVGVCMTVCVSGPLCCW